VKKWIRERLSAFTDLLYNQYCTYNLLNKELKETMALIDSLRSALAAATADAAALSQDVARVAADYAAALANSVTQSDVDQATAVGASIAAAQAALDAADAVPAAPEAPAS
jgi:peptidoglycan hydrolase CwlO-like protein